VKRYSWISLAVTTLLIVAVAALAGGRGGGSGFTGGGGGKTGKGSFDTKRGTTTPPAEPITEPAAGGTAAATGTDAAATGTDGAEGAAEPGEPTLTPAVPAATPTAPAAPSFGMGGRSFGGGGGGMGGMSPRSAPAGLIENYGILTDRNIFMKIRGRPAVTTRVATVRAAPVENPDDRIVLTGIIQQGEGGVAFFEDTRSRKTLQVQAGDTVGQGRLASVSLDEVKYVRQGTTTRLTVGNTLSGRAGTLSTPVSTTAVATTPVPGGGGSRMGGFGGFGGGRGGPPEPVAPAAGGGTPVTMAGPPDAIAPTQPQIIITVAPSDMGDDPGMDEPPAAGSAAGNPAAMDNGAASTLERMRQRRAQELN
jgi:hypothetical protein